jgi:hypothetical protein
MVREMQHSEVETVICPLIKDELTRFSRPVIVGTISAHDTEDGIIS